MRRLPRFDFLKWFYPGMHIKRWLALLVIGVAVMTFGLAYILREAYVSGFPFPPFMYYLTLQFIPRYIRGATFMFGAGGLILFSIWKLNQSIVSAVMPHRAATDSLVNTIYNRRFLRRGPKIVAIGGGTGLSTLLRGLKEYTTNLTAIVTVADDGGSSGGLGRGQITPSTLANVTLYAKTDDAGTIQGESSISDSKTKGRIKEVFLLPKDPPAPPEAARAILDAHMIILGPGSLYTR